MATELENAMTMTIKAEDIEDMCKGEFTEALDLLMNRMLRAHDKAKEDGVKIAYVIIKVTG